MKNRFSFLYLIFVKFYAIWHFLVFIRVDLNGEITVYVSSLFGSRFWSGPIMGVWYQS